MSLMAPRTKATATIPNPVKRLLSMLTYKRPAGSQAEVDFINRWIIPLGTRQDTFGNEWVTVGQGSPILWSSHTDTVHRTSGIQQIMYGDGIVSTEDGECLGADCTVGVWIMREMILAAVPGTYVFHREEEIGGNGSAWVAKNRPDLLADIKFAIALDRKGTTDVITHQWGGRCASEAFAQSLCEALAPMNYSPSESGVFTDTANYADLVPECTNIAVGYYRQHQATEVLDVPHAVRLLAQLKDADLSKLVCARTAGDWDIPWYEKDISTGSAALPYGDVEELEAFCRADPDIVARYLDALGVTAADLDAFSFTGRL